MTTGARTRSSWGRAEWALVAWVGLALAALWPVTSLLDGAFPTFTVVWLAVPLVAVLRSGRASRVSFRPVPLRTLSRVTLINLGLVALLMAAFEPWSQTYRSLVRLAVSSSPLDTTFGWLVRYDGPTAWAGLALYSSLVTLFAEELFFRGWLLQALRPRVGTTWAVVGQAAAFTAPNLMAALFLPPPQGVLYAVVYSFLAIGLVGGWAADRTGSIWPSLITASVANLALTALVR